MNKLIEILRAEIATHEDALERLRAALAELTKQGGATTSDSRPSMTDDEAARFITPGLVPKAPPARDRTESVLSVIRGGTHDYLAIVNATGASELEVDSALGHLIGRGDIEQTAHQTYYLPGQPDTPDVPAVLDEKPAKVKRQRSKADAADHSALHARIAEYVANDPKGVKAGDIAHDFELSRSQTSTALEAMVRAGTLRMTGRNNGTRYWPANAESEAAE